MVRQTARTPQVLDMRWVTEAVRGAIFPVLSFFFSFFAFATLPPPPPFYQCADSYAHVPMRGSQAPGRRSHQQPSKCTRKERKRNVTEKRITKKTKIHTASLCTTAVFCESECGDVHSYLMRAVAPANPRRDATTGTSSGPLRFISGPD